MQLKEHEYTSTTEGNVTVEFHGDGNELITVRMAVDQAADKQNSILRARGMIGQIAAPGDDEQSLAVRGEG